MNSEQSNSHSLAISSVRPFAKVSIHHVRPVSWYRADLQRAKVGVSDSLPVSKVGSLLLFKPGVQVLLEVPDYIPALAPEGGSAPTTAESFQRPFG